MTGQHTPSRSSLARARSGAALVVALLLLSGCSFMESVWDGVAFWRDDPTPTEKLMGSTATKQFAPDQSQLRAELTRLEAERQALDSRINDLRRMVMGPEPASAPVQTVMATAAPTKPASEPAKAPAMAAAAPKTAKPPATGGDVFAEGGGFAVHLASYRKAEDARRGWQQLNKSMAGPLTGLEARIISVDFNDGRGTFIRLKAGPFASRDLAMKKCAEIKAAGQFCGVDTFTGEAVAGAGPTG